jgi:biopolymer transport protein ExbD
MPKDSTTLIIILAVAGGLVAIVLVLFVVGAVMWTMTGSSPTAMPPMPGPATVSPPTSGSSAFTTVVESAEPPADDPSPDPAQAMEIKVRSGGQIFVDDEAVSLNELGVRLAAMEESPCTVQIRYDPQTVPYEDVAKVLLLVGKHCKAGGQITLSTAPADDEAGSAPVPAEAP